MNILKIIKNKKEGGVSKTVTKECTNKCVGMIVWKGTNLLMVERKTPPFGFAIPTGHLEEDEDFEEAAIRELKEETGLIAIQLRYLMHDCISILPFCSKGSIYSHNCRIYRVFYEDRGEITINKEEIKIIGWYDLNKIKKLSLRMKKYLDGRISEKEWERSPGLNPICYRWFLRLGIL